MNPDRKRYVNPFEIDESDTALSAPKFFFIDLDHDDAEQGEINILTV